MKVEKVYIDQILDSIRKIESFVAGMDKKMFFSDEKTQSAVILQLALIGEVSKKISAKTKELIDLPWKDIAGFRDRAIHDYFDVELDIVWKTVVTDLDPIKQKLI